MAISKIIYKTDSSDTGTVWMDVTQKTVTAGSMLNGTTALKNDGTDITGNIATKTSANLTASGATVTAPAGYYASDASKSVASGTEGTPTATKGTVSNHAVTVTPSVTNTAGYISGGTHTGTGVSVSVSELESGTKEITSNGTGISVSGYSAVDVSVTPSLQAKSNISPTTSSQTISADNGYDGLSSVQINAMPSGSATAPATISGSSATVSTGTNTLTLSKTVSVTPTVSAGYVSSGTAGNSAVSLTASVNTRSSSDLTASTLTVTAPAGYYASDATKTLTDANLSAGNIKKDVTIFGTTGTYEGSGGGGDYTSADVKNLIERNNSLTSFTFPSGITKIGDGAFWKCANLNFSSLPNTVTVIRPYAFNGCTSLALSSLPSGVSTIGDYAFYGCTSLALSSLPSNVTTINPYAFTDCHNITITEFSDKVVLIGTASFQGCNGITSISGNGVIMSLSQSAFLGKTSYPMALTSARFPNMALTSNLGTAFGSTTAANACQQLEIVDLGSTPGINANAFANCYKLQTLVLRKTASVCTLANTSAFTNTPMAGYNSLTGTVYVPNDLIASYRTASNWSSLYSGGTVNFVKIEGSAYEIS